MKHKKLQSNAKRSFKDSVVKEIRQNWELYLLIAIPMIYLLVFKYIPMYGVQIAFRKYKVGAGFTGGEWVGLEYVLKFFNNYQFWDLLKNTLELSIYSLLTFPIPIAFAILLNYIKQEKFKKTVQMVTYAPYFISTVVMVSIILQFLDSRSGAVNQIIQLFGGKAANWMANPDAFKHIFVWSGVWQTLGYSAIMYISALAGVSPELHEAAIVDGANILQRIWYVDLPGILPTVMIMLILRCGSILSVGYEKVYLMQNSLNISASEIISTYVYKQGLGSGIPQYSYSTAIGLFVSIINVILLLTVNKIVDKMTGSSLF